MRDSVEQMRFPRPRRARLVALPVLLAITLAACGDDDQSPAASDASTASAAPIAAGPLVKPTVSIPAELPTELVITDLVEGTGKGAALGDTVLVHYVGVRSADGTEFDNNYDGSAFEVTLGQTGVIQGWTDGLVGVKQGGQRQLDIPADLAYGDSPKGDVIQAGDALSFVIDVTAVVPVGDPADAPDISVAGAANQEKIGIEDLVEGTGPVAQAGQTVAVQVIAYRADTGEQISSTWTEGAVPFTFVLNDGSVLPGIELAVEGMAVGGRRQVHVPYLLAFGEEGRDEFGLPAKTDMVLVVDLVGAF